MNKIVLFVGAFNKRKKKDLYGGQLYACESLVNSNLSEKYTFIKLCSTQRSIPPPNFFLRFYDSILRIVELIQNIIFKKIDIALIFTGDGMGFLEKGLMIFLCKKNNIKTILFPRSGLIKNDIRNKYFKYFLIFTLKNTNYLMTQGNTWKNFFLKYIDNKNKIIVQQNWINTSCYNNKRDFTNKKLNILYLGWVDKQKGIFDLLEVFKKLVVDQKRKNISLIIAGKGKDFDLLISEVKRLKINNNIKIKGWVNKDEKLKILKESDIYVHPSYFEGFPNSLLEALSSGIPSVATNVGSIPDLISHKKNGYLYNPGKLDDLETFLIKLIDDFDLRKLFSDNSILRTNNYNSINIAIKNFDKILSEI